MESGFGELPAELWRVWALRRVLRRMDRRLASWRGWRRPRPERARAPSGCPVSCAPAFCSLTVPDLAMTCPTAAPSLPEAARPAIKG